MNRVTVSPVVVQWARARKRYERQGILVTREAIDRAEVECLADEDSRTRQRERAAARRVVEDREYEAAVAKKLQAQFPGCPAAEAARAGGGTVSGGGRSPGAGTS